MRKERRIFFLLVTAAVSGMVLAGIPESAANLELFHVDRFDVEGGRHLSSEEVRSIAALPTGATIWDSTDPVAERIQSHPLVQDVRVRRRIPSTLRVELREREPVGLVAGQVLMPVDGEGNVLPLDPADLRLDLPLLAPGADREEDDSDEPVPTRVALLASELVRIGDLDPHFAAQLSEIRAGPDGGVILSLTDPRVDLTYNPPLRPGRLREGLLVLADALERTEDAAPTALDLRFGDQVVVRFTKSTGN